MFAKKNLDKRFFGLPGIKFFSTKWLTPDLNLCFSIPDGMFFTDPKFLLRISPIYNPSPGYKPTKIPSNENKTKAYFQSLTVP